MSISLFAVASHAFCNILLKLEPRRTALLQSTGFDTYFKTRTPPYCITAVDGVRYIFIKTRTPPYCCSRRGSIHIYIARYCKTYCKNLQLRLQTAPSNSVPDLGGGARCVSHFLIVECAVMHHDKPFGVIKSKKKDILLRHEHGPTAVRGPAMISALSARPAIHN